MVTIALKSVENPLEFGVVIVDEEGRIERFLEKPGWGQVFSDTINTGIYVLEPTIFDHIPEGASFDFSHELFPRLYELRKPLYGVLCEGYWQDIGSLEQYLQANRDALDGKVRLQIPGVRLRGNVWVGQGVSLDSLSNVEGPAVIGNYAKIDPTAVIGAHTVLGNNAVLKAGRPGGRTRSWATTATWRPGTRVRGADPGELGRPARQRGGLRRSGRRRPVLHRRERPGGQQRQGVPVQDHRGRLGHQVESHLRDPGHERPLRQDTGYAA